LSPEAATELIERIDRGEDPQEIVSFAYDALRGARSEDAQASRRDDGAVSADPRLPRDT